MFFKLSGFGDEIAEDFETQLRELRGMDINFIALRNLWGVNILKLDAAQRKRARLLLRQYGMGISEIASPIGKSLITESWDAELERIEAGIAASKYFGCPRIRVFSYYMPEGDPLEKHRREVIRRMREMTARAEREGIILLHENDEGIYGADGIHLHDLMRAVDSPNFKAAFDPSNFVTIGTHAYTQWWDMLKDDVVHFHVKDQKFDRTQVPAGEGDGEFRPILREFAERGFVGFAVMEPHLAQAGQFTGFSGPELFAHATKAFRALCDEAGIGHRQVRTGIIGAGFIGGFHAKALEVVPEAHLVAIADVVESAKLRELQEQYNIEAYTNPDEMLARGDIDAVTICTPSGLHGELAIKAMESGKHALTEKPLEVTLAKADAMIETSRRTGKSLGVISQHRTDPGIIELRDAIESGALGKVILAEAYVKWHRTQAYYDSGGWRGTMKLDGGGALMNQGVHTVDMLQHVMGSPVESVIAQTALAAHERIEVEDIAQALLKFKNGALGMIIATTAAHPGFPERIEVTGTKGTIIVEKDAVVLRDIEGEAVRGRREAGTAAVGASNAQAIDNRGHVDQLRDFCQAINGKRVPLVPGEEGRIPLEIILAVYESAKSGQRVLLPLC